MVIECMNKDILISDFRACSAPVSYGLTPKELAFEVYELNVEHAEAISQATLCAEGVVDKTVPQVIDHFETGGTGLAVFIDNVFAGQVLIKDSDVPASDIKFLPEENQDSASDLDASYLIKVSTVSSIAPTAIPENQINGYSFPLMDAWYETAVANKRQLLQGCVQVDNTKGLNMFTRNDFVTDGTPYQSPSGSHNVFFMYRSADQSIGFDKRHDQPANSSEVVIPAVPQAMRVNCC